MEAVRALCAVFLIEETLVEPENSTEIPHYAKFYRKSDCKRDSFYTSSASKVVAQEFSQTSQGRFLQVGKIFSLSSGRVVTFSGSSCSSA